MDEERLVKLIIDNTPNQIQGMEGHYDATSTRVNSMFNTIIKTMQNVVGAVKWVENLSYSGAHGYIQKGTYIPESKLEEVLNQLKIVEGQVGAKGAGFAVTTSSATKIAQNMPLKSKEAAKKAQEIASYYGGEYDKEAGVVLIPVDTTDKDIGSKRLGLLERANTARKFTEATNLEKESLSRVNEYAKQEAERKAAKDYLDQLDRNKTSQESPFNEWAKQEGQKAASKLEQQKARAYLDQLDKSRGGGEDPEDKVENKHQNFMTGLLKNPFVQILTSFGITIALLRRITSSLISNALKNAEATRKEDRDLGIALGLTVRQLKDAAIFERSHGLEKGTIGNAVMEVNKAFGDVRNVDATSEVVQNMALLGVRGGDPELITRLATQGLTQEDPEVLTEAILDAAMTAYKGRKNVLTGESYTGAKAGEQSMRSILSFLEGAGFQNTAVLFEQWVQDQENSIYRGMPMNTFAEWRATTAASKTKDEKLDALKTLQSLVNSLLGRLDAIKDVLYTNIALKLAGLFDWLNNVELFMSPEEKVERRAQNRIKNEKFISTYTPEAEKLKESILAKLPALAFDKEGVPKITGDIATAVAKDASLRGMLTEYMVLQKDINEANANLQKSNVPYNVLSTSPTMQRVEAAEQSKKFTDKFIQKAKEGALGSEFDDYYALVADYLISTKGGLPTSNKGGIQITAKEASDMTTKQKADTVRQVLKSYMKYDYKADKGMYKDIGTYMEAAANQTMTTDVAEGMNMLLNSLAKKRASLQSFIPEGYTGQSVSIHKDQKSRNVSIDLNLKGQKGETKTIHIDEFTAELDKNITLEYNEALGTFGGGK